MKGKMFLYFDRQSVCTVLEYKLKNYVGLQQRIIFSIDISADYYSIINLI